MYWVKPLAHRRKRRGRQLWRRALCFSLRGRVVRVGDNMSFYNFNLNLCVRSTLNHHAHALNESSSTQFRRCKEDYYRSPVSGDCFSCAADSDDSRMYPHLEPILVLVFLVLIIMMWFMSHFEWIAAIYERRKNQILVATNHSTMMYV